MDRVDWSMLAAIGQLAAAVFAGVGFWLVWLQLRAASRLATADFVIRLESEFIDHHVETYQKFLSGGSLADEGPGPANDADISDIEHYLDFFGTLQLLRTQRLIDLSTIDGMFAYRFFSIANNKHTLQIVRGKIEYWGLVQRLYIDWTDLRRKRGDAIPKPELERIWRSPTSTQAAAT
jgi:hypothetical protein